MANSLCGCWFVVPGHYTYTVEMRYLPLVDLSSHTTILATTSRTVLTQKFTNSTDKAIDEVQYTFPLYDGVSVVGFKCTVASRTIVGVVKEKQQARAEYKEAVDRGETAGLLEQLPEAADVFTTRIGNVPARESVTVELVYLGELKHDAETDGARFTIPTVIAPRYGQVAVDQSNLPMSSTHANDKGGIRILVDVVVDEGSAIRGLQSPTHPIAVSMGRTSATPEDDTDSFHNHLASATLTLGSTELEKDFIIVVLAKGQDTPRAMLEHHPSIRGQRALVATLVPRFNLPPIYPEIVFVVDRSGSMNGKIDTLVAALKIFLKSLPVGVKFNICSFGSNYNFLWPKSKAYDQSSLQKALDHLKTFSANYGGTEMLKPVEATVKNRWKDMPLEVMVITDGEIWNQQSLFDFINKTTATKKDARFFSLGIGAGASSSLVEGIARAGDGFAQFVGENEKMDKRVVRMLKGALMPHIHDYTLEVKYEREDDEYEIVESVTESLNDLVIHPPEAKSPTLKKKVISLFDKSASVEEPAPPAGRYDHLPAIAVPKLLQAPHKIPPLYPFNRTTVYLLMSTGACQRTPNAVILRATSNHGPLELEIPIQDVGIGETIHQLAAKKAIQELEEGRGWVTEAKDANGKLIKEKHEGRWDEMVEREAVRLGVEFQVGGKWCSFVAVQTNSDNGECSESALNREKSKSRSRDTWDGTLSDVSSQTLGSAQLGGFEKRSKSSSVPKPPPPMRPPPDAVHDLSPPKSGTPFGLFGSTPSGGGLFALSKTLAGEGSSDRINNRPFGDSFNAGRPYMRKCRRRSSGSLSRGLFGSSDAPLSNSDADSGSPTARSRKSKAMASVGFGASMMRREAAAAEVQPGISSEVMVAAPCPPPAPPCGALQRQPAQFDSAQQQQQQAPPGALGQLHAPVPAQKWKKSKGEDLSEAADAEMVDAVDEHAIHAGPSVPATEERKQKSQTIEDRMHTLIALQAFDGSWTWESNLFAALGMDEAKLRAICESAGVVDDGKVRATVVAIAFLQTKAKADEEVWEMVVNKAMGLLKGKVDDGQLETVKHAVARE